jgi:hypothetical protein
MAHDETWGAEWQAIAPALCQVIRDTCEAFFAELKDELDAKRCATLQEEAEAHLAAILARRLHVRAHILGSDGPEDDPEMLVILPMDWFLPALDVDEDRVNEYLTVPLWPVFEAYIATCLREDGGVSAAAWAAQLRLYADQLDAKAEEALTYTPE